MPIPTGVTIDEVLGRIGKQVDAAANLKVQVQNIKKILKFNHLGLHTSFPNMLREYLTLSESLAITAGNPYQHLLLTGLTHRPKEIQSVAFLSSTDMQPYKRTISLEHFSGLLAYDEDRLDGRYWFQNRGEDKLLIFQGTNVSGSETSLYVGYVRELSTDYSTSSAQFDCPPEAVRYIIAQTVVDALIDKKAQIPEYLGQDLQKQEGVMTALDQALSQQFRALEDSGRDVR